MRFGVCWALGSPQPVRRFSTRRQHDLFKSTYVPVQGDPACWSCLHEERVSGVGKQPARQLSFRHDSSLNSQLEISLLQTTNKVSSSQDTVL